MFCRRYCSTSGFIVAACFAPFSCALSAILVLFFNVNCSGLRMKPLPICMLSISANAKYSGALNLPKKLSGCIKTPLFVTAIKQVFLENNEQPPIIAINATLGRLNAWDNPINRSPIKITPVIDKISQ